MKLPTFLLAKMYSGWHEKQAIEKYSTTQQFELSWKSHSTHVEVTGLMHSRQRTMARTERIPCNEPAPNGRSQIVSRNLGTGIDYLKLYLHTKRYVVNTTQFGRLLGS